MRLFYALRCYLLFSCLVSAGIAHTQSIRLNEFMASNQSVIADETGDYDDWVELYNAGTEAINLSGFYLSDNVSNPFKWQIPATDSAVTTIAAGGFLLLWLDDAAEAGPLHLPFKLSAGGEDILVSSPDSILLDVVSFGQQTTDISLARLPDGTGEWIICSTPTPGFTNTSSTSLPVADSPIPSVSSGRHDAPFLLSFSSDTPAAEIRISFSGKEPDQSDSLYTQPIDIQSTTIIKARVYAANFLPGRATTCSYLFVPPHHFPVVSLVFDPDDFFDTLSGIYTHPLDFSEIEVPIHATWIEPDGTTGFDADLGVELFGNGSLTLPQKSLLLKAKPSFGAQEIEFQVFPDLSQDKFKRLVLRNSGQDWGVTMFRDGLVGSLGREIEDVTPVLKDFSLQFQAFRPTVVYLNGEYWGIHNAREQHNKQFIQQHFGSGSDPIDFIEFYGEALEGDSISWQQFWQWVSENNFYNDLKFKELAEKNDMDNFTDYCVFQIVTDNVDWPGKNWRRFRSRNEGSRWQWLPYDFDLSYGLLNTDFSWNTGYAGQNAFSRAIDSTFSTWASADWQTLILRRSLENQHYRHYFLNRTADLLNTIFEKNRMLARIDSFEGMFLPEIERHFERWYGSPGWLPYWKENVQKMKDFAGLRTNFCFEHALEVFPETTKTAQVSLAADPPEAGVLYWSTLQFDVFPWQGRYFQNIPIPVKALARPGWHFVGWSHSHWGETDSISVTLSGDLNLTALFELDSIPETTAFSTPIPRFSLSPNPAKAVTELSATMPIQQISIYNAVGILQQYYPVEKKSTTTTLLNIKHLPAGIYWIEVLLGNGQKETNKLIKQE